MAENIEVEAQTSVLDLQGLETGPLESACISLVSSIETSGGGGGKG
jgi:hypothetical protein